MKSKHEAGEGLNTPGMSEDHLSISHVHTELVAEALLNIIGNFLKLLVCFGNPSVRDLESWQVWILEETVVGLILFFTEGVSDILFGVVSSGLELWNFAFTQECDVSTILVLDCALDIFSASNVFDFDTVSADFV